MQTTGGLDANGNPVGWAAHEHTTYDTSGRVTAELGQEGPATSPTTVVNQTACYDTASTAPTCGTNKAYDVAKIQFIVDSVSGETAKFSYDNHATGQGQTGRLLTTTITGGSNPRTYTYGYNAAGDRTTASVTGSSPSTQTLSFNNANQITTTGYTYDASGNQTANPAGTATFNTAAQQTSVVRGGKTTTYTYAGTNSDELLTESTPNNHNYGLVYGRPDQSGLPEVEQVQYDTNTAYIQHDPTTGAPLMLQTSSNVNCLYMTDITGNPILLSTSFNTTAFAEQYDPYGAATQTGGTTTNGGVTENPYLFHFGLQDRITGDVKFGGRFYDPTTGTWTQQDSYNAPLNPGNANRYLYAGGDPIDAADATGSSIWGDVAKGAAVALGAAAVFATGGAALGLGLAATAADVGGDYLNGASGVDTAVDAGIDLATAGAGSGLEAAGVEGSSLVAGNAGTFSLGATANVAGTYSDDGE